MSARKHVPLLLAGLLAVSLLPGRHSVPAAEPAGSGVAKETKAERDRRMAWWREARFGMFIHWGLYAVPAGEWKGRTDHAEWIMETAHIPVDQYEKFRDRFNPVKFNADQWVAIAKSAGCKYIVITSKHHDGFCLFDSKHTDYDVMSTPFRRDIMKELAEACRRQGLRICWYHSIMDWHHPDYLPRRGWEKRSAQGADFPRYVGHLKDQVRELVTAYGRIGVLWFDGEWESTWTHEHGLDLYRYVRSLDPEIIINNRVDKGRHGMAGLTREGGFAGDFGTPEQEIPPTGLSGADWETCMTMNDHWGYNKHDQNWKSNEDLIRKLIDIASKGGNFLLNVGPTGEGEIPRPSVERLAAMGKWLKTNGEAIYGTAASPFKKLPWGRATRKPGKLYLHVFQWPKGDLAVPGLKNKVEKAYLLADASRAALQATQTEEGVLLKVPEKAPDAIASVVVLEIVGEPEVAAAGTTQAADGTLTLAATEAVVHGRTARYESGDGKDNIGFWTNPKDFVTWDAAVKKMGTFEVEITYACQDGAAGSDYTVSVLDQELKGRVEATGAWNRFVTKKLGTLRLPGSGRYTFTAKAATMPHGAVMNLKSIVLKPAK